jgi:hypothetical protein
MDKFTAMRTFVRIVEAGSLTAAADSLDTSLPTVVRTLARSNVSSVSRFSSAQRGGCT